MVVRPGGRHNHTRYLQMLLRRKNCSSPQDWRSKLERILWKCGEQCVWVALKEPTGMGLRRAGAGFEGMLCLAGIERGKRTAVSRLLRGYQATNQPLFLEIPGPRPRRTCIAGLMFVDEHHVVVVVQKLIERHFASVSPQIQVVAPSARKCIK